MKPGFGTELLVCWLLQVVLVWLNYSEHSLIGELFERAMTERLECAN